MELFRVKINANDKKHPSEQLGALAGVLFLIIII